MTSTPRPARIGFLLTQLGSEAARKFAVRTKALGITSAQAGVIRIVGRQSGISQRDLAGKLHAVQSRVVALIDSLEELGYVIRVRSTTDRRSYALQLTEQGTEMLDKLRSAAEAYEADVTRGLSPSQTKTLAELLSQMSASSGLDPDVHPGYSQPDSKFEPLVFPQLGGAKPKG